MNLVFVKRNYWEKGDKDSLLRNGAVFLEKLITSSSHGEYNPIRNFSAKELKMATNNYDEDKVIIKKGFYKLYKCFLHKRPISVMKFEEETNEFCFKNIVFASTISHKNVLKLTGCCLVTKIPILVFEYVEYCTLAYHLRDSSHPHCKPLSWTNRLKIAMEIANVIAYLHIGLPRPIVFCNIKSSNILFDEHFVTKVFDFLFSEFIPEGETHITKTLVRGTCGYVALEFLATTDLNEKCDVYSFGVLLFMLLTGQKMLSFCCDETTDIYLLNYVKKYNEDNNKLYEIVDPIIDQDGLCPKREQQLHAFTELAFKCVSISMEERPPMIDVAKQLRKLYQFGV